MPIERRVPCAPLGPPRDEPTNLVAACVPCNQLKANSTLRELGWSLHRVGPTQATPLFDLDDVPVAWRPFLPVAA